MYPREINLDPETEAALRMYLQKEIINHRGEKSNWLAELEVLQRDYLAEPKSTVRTFPFRGAANIIIPLTQIAANTIHARNMMTAFATDQIVSAKVAPKYADIDRQLERYIDWELIFGCKYKKAADNCSLEFTKFGTGIMKSLWRKEVRKAVRPTLLREPQSQGSENILTESLPQEEEFEVVTYQGPTVDCVAQSTFMMPFGFQDPQTAPWCGEEHISSSERFRIMEDSGMFRKGSYAKIESYFSSLESRIDQNLENFKDSVQKTSPANWQNKLCWYELYLTYDIDKSKSPKEIVVLFHYDSGTFLSVRYNWFSDLRRPYELDQFIPLEHRWAGLGTAHQSKQFQREITTQHRQRLDNGTIVNTRMFKADRLSGISTNEPIFPGKIWLVDKVDQLESFQSGEVYTSAYNNESQSMMMWQQLVGVNELNLGMPQAGTPDTAINEQARLQEGNRKFDYSYRNWHDLQSRVITNVVLNIAQFGHRDTRYFDFLEGEDGAKLRAFFDLPVDLLRSGIPAKFNLVSASNNKVQDRNSWTQLTGIGSQYYQGLIESIVQFFPQIAPQAVLQMMKGSTEGFKQVLDSFDIRDPHKLTFEPIIKLIEAQLNGSNPMVNTGPNSGTPINGQSPILANPGATNNQPAIRLL